MKYALPLLMAALVSGCAAALPPNSGQAAPDFSVTTLDGGTITLAGLKGKVVLVNFWATWCSPCRAEIPDFAAFYAKNKDNGFEIIGLSVDEMSAAELKPFLAALKVNYPIALATPKIIRDFAPGGYIPTTFVIDKKGMIRDKQVGGMDMGSFEELFSRLSAEK
jgi:peroxiredoxin